MSKVISVKKLLAVLVALAMTAALVPAAFAAGNATISIIDCTVVDDLIELEINISGLSNDTHVISMVTEAAKGINYNNAVAIQYTHYKSTDRQVTIDIGMPDLLETGYYNVSVGSPDAPVVQSMYIAYVSVPDRESILGNINSDSPDVAALIRDFDSTPLALTSAGSNNDYYTALSQNAKEDFFEYIIANRKPEKDGTFALTLEDVGKLADKAFVVVYASNSTLSDSALELGYKEVIPGALRINTEDERYVKISNYKGFFQVLRSQDEWDGTDKGIKNSWTKAITLQRINEVGYLELAQKILDYRKVLDFENNENVTVTRADLEEITENSNFKKYFGKAMKGDGSEYKNLAEEDKLPANTLAQFATILERAYDDGKTAYEKYLKEKEKDDNKGSGSGSGSSGGGSGSKGGGLYSVDYKTVRPDPLEKKKLIDDYYDDMAGFEWASSAVLALTESGIVNGTGERTFSPAKLLTREEFMKLLVNTFNLVDAKAVCTFTDVTDTNAWYYIYVASAQKAGITTGRGDGTFGLGDYVTREEMATLVYRAAINSGINLSTVGRNNAAYYDVNSLSAFARDAVVALTAHGVMSGSNGMFSPQDSASRAQAAVVINNINNLKITK